MPHCDKPAVEAMTDHSTQGDAGDSGEQVRPVGPEPVAAGSDGGDARTAAYEQEGVVVLYDTENPLAWIEAGNTVEVGQMA
jgi:hypothetical protein